MTTAKEEVTQLLDNLPADVSYDDIQYEIYVRQKIREGLEALDAGWVLSQEEVERRMGEWLGRYHGPNWPGGTSIWPQPTL